MHGDIYMCGEGDSGIYVTDLYGTSSRHIPGVGVRHKQPPLRGFPLKLEDSHGSPATLSCMAMSSDGALLLTGDASGQVVVRAARCLTVLRVLALNRPAPRTGRAGSSDSNIEGAVLSMAFSPCDNFLLVSTQLGQVHVHLAELSSTESPMNHDLRNLV